MYLDSLLSRWVSPSIVKLRLSFRVSVATKQAANPVNSIAEGLNLVGVVAPVMNLPLKLVFGHTMLGELNN